MAGARKYGNASPPVAVLYGGFSGEREVSLESGAAVAKALEEAGLATKLVDVRPDFTEAGRAALEGCGCAFIALHGEFGEDGGVQRLLEAWGVPYTGSGPEASALAMDKVASKERFLERGVPTAGSVTCAASALAAGEWPDGLDALDWPVVVKPALAGSSLGISIVERPEGLAEAGVRAAEHGGVALVERFVPGREVTVGVLADEALPVVELETAQNFYDYEAKYRDGRTRYVVPAEIPDEVTARVQEAGLAAFRALGCRSFGRTDLRLDPSGRPFVLEVNTIPGFTSHSLLPKAAAAAGVPFPELCRRIVKMAAPRRR